MCFFTDTSGRWLLFLTSRFYKLRDDWSIWTICMIATSVFFSTITFWSIQVVLLRACAVCCLGNTVLHQSCSSKQFCLFLILLCLIFFKGFSFSFLLQFFWYFLLSFLQHQNRFCEASFVKYNIIHVTFTCNSLHDAQN